MNRSLYRVTSSLPSLFVALLGATFAVPAAAAYVQTNLVSDIPNFAAFTDPNLKNPWGIASSPTSPFWVSNNGTGTSTLYDTVGQPQSLVVTIPPSPGGTPSGQVFNGGAGFELAPGQPARFIFATEGGTIAGWNPASNPTNALTQVITPGGVYKGLAIGNNGSGDFLYAANFAQGTIDVFNSTFASTSLPGSFTDPNLPSGYAPFNIQHLGNILYVTYAVRSGNDDLPGPGNGIVDAFDLNGNLIRRVVSQGGALNSPWGLALTPAAFGDFSNALLVGNFGDGKINAFNPTTGALLGTLSDMTTSPIVIDGLWGLRFGNGGNGGNANTLYFTAGLNDEQNGLFGSIAAVSGPTVPEPATLALLGLGLAGLAATRRRKQ